MKKGLILCLALVMAFAMVASAVTDDFAPRPPTKKAGAKATTSINNMYFTSSVNRGLGYSDLTNITNFNYRFDGKWLFGMPTQIAIKADGNPVVAFDGGNDFNGYSHTWFWSGATGLVVVDSSAGMHVWSSVAVADNGDIYVSWGDYYGGFYPGWENTTAGDIFIARSTDNGATWGAKVNVSSYIQALNPNDSCQTYPKLARRAISGVHLLWADDSKIPGSGIQDVPSVGAFDSVFIRYAKVNLDLSGLDATVGVNDMGWTAYDWAITGNTQGIAIDSIEQAA
ncbi:MAG: sialidase family protein, partial [bacterium]|nr:sialidase family protein [bacterium]